MPEFFQLPQGLGGVAGFVAANLLQFSLKGPHRLMFLHPWYPGMALFEEVMETLGEGLARVSHWKQVSGRTLSISVCLSLSRIPVLSVMMLVACVTCSSYHNAPPKHTEPSCYKLNPLKLWVKISASSKLSHFQAVWLELYKRKQDNLGCFWSLFHFVSAYVVWFAEPLYLFALDVIYSVLYIRTMSWLTHVSDVFVSVTSIALFCSHAVS